MKVKDFIEQLNKFDPEADVRFSATAIDGETIDGALILAASVGQTFHMYPTLNDDIWTDMGDGEAVNIAIGYPPE